jgi:hypothetical protein
MRQRPKLRLVPNCGSRLMDDSVPLALRKAKQGVQRNARVRGNGAELLRRGGDFPVDPVAHRGLRDIHLPSELSLRNGVVFQVPFESFHGGSIGDSDKSAIGQTYPIARHTAGMALQTPSTFWTRTKEAFDEAKLDSTQEGVAKFLGIKQPSIPDGFPTMANAIKLAHKANVCVEWLLTGRGPRRLPPKDGAAEHLWQIWNNLPPVRQAQVIGFAQTIQGDQPEQLGR